VACRTYHWESAVDPTHGECLGRGFISLLCECFHEIRDLLGNEPIGRLWWQSLRLGHMNQGVGASFALDSEVVHQRSAVSTGELRNFVIAISIESREMHQWLLGSTKSKHLLVTGRKWRPDTELCSLVDRGKFKDKSSKHAVEAFVVTVATEEAPRLLV
jgi:hypothetical protein